MSSLETRRDTYIFCVETTVAGLRYRGFWLAILRSVILNRYSNISSASLSIRYNHISSASLSFFFLFFFFFWSHLTVVSALPRSDMTYEVTEFFLKSETELTAKFMKKRSKTYKRLKEHFVIGRNRTKRANFRGNPFFKLRTT